MPLQQGAPFGEKEWCEQQWHAKMKEEGGFSGLAARGTSNESLTAAEGREGGERRDWLPLPPGILVPRQQGILQGEKEQRKQQRQGKMKEEAGIYALATRGVSTDALAAAAGREEGERRDWLPIKTCMNMRNFQPCMHRKMKEEGGRSSRNSSSSSNHST